MEIMLHVLLLFGSIAVSIGILWLFLFCCIKLFMFLERL